MSCSTTLPTTALGRASILKPVCRTYSAVITSTDHDLGYSSIGSHHPPLWAGHHDSRVLQSTTKSRTPDENLLYCRCWYPDEHLGGAPQIHQLLAVLLSRRQDRKGENKVALLTDKAIPWDGLDAAGKTVVELFEILGDSGKVISGHGLAGRFSTDVGNLHIRQSVNATEVQEGNPDKSCSCRTKAVDVHNLSLYEE